MEKNLVIIKTNYPGKQLGNLKYRFEYYLILEKIFREISFISDFENFIKNIFEILRIYHPDLDFFVDIFDEFDIGTNKFCIEKLIFSGELKYYKDQFGEFKITGAKINKFEKKIFEKIISHICLYYMFFINRYIISSDQNSKIYNDFEESDKIFKNMLETVQFFLHEDVECDNVYVFLRQNSKLIYYGNLYNKHTEISGKENNIIMDVLEKKFSIRSNIIEFSKEEKIEVSKNLGINVKNIIVLPIRSTEELLGYAVLTNIYDYSAEKEKVLDLYSVYFEKLFVSLNKNKIELNREGMLKMYSIAAKMLEEENNDNLNPFLEKFFMFFKKFFNLSNINIFFIKNYEFNSIYSTSLFFNEKVLKEKLDQNKGKVIYSEKDGFNYIFFEQENRRCGLFAYEVNEHFDEQNKNNVENFANLIFNILYSRKNLQNLRELDRLAVLGRMAREMAHEIRNPLGGIRLFVEILKKKNETNIDIYESIIKGIDNINSVISGMLEFTGNTYLDLKEEYIVKILLDTLKLVPQLKDVRITYNIEEEFLCIVDKEKMTRVFLNILKNAVEALENEKQPHIRIETEIQGNKILITIWNNGGEIPEIEKNKIFSPFFTTKKKGNGIGLCISRKLVNEHKGEINLKTVNGWTGFEIILKGKKI